MNVYDNREGDSAYRARDGAGMLVYQKNLGGRSALIMSFTTAKPTDANGLLV